MGQLIYLKDVVTLALNEEKCAGCGTCELVCPHKVFRLNNGKVAIVDRDACMECVAEDLPAFMDNGMKATAEMRVKTFHARERVALIPVELVEALKAAVVIAPVLLFLSGLLGPASFWPNVLTHGLFAVQALITAIFAGAVLTPLLLPWLPGRAFSLKSLAPGLFCALLLLLLRWGDGVKAGSLLEMIAWVLIILSAAAYLGMNFTGASTYTSLSGVKKEMRWSLPFQIGGGVVGLVLWVCSMLVDHGV